MGLGVSSLALGEALAGIVGSDHVRRDGAARAVHAVAGVVPRVIVRPATTEEVGRVVAMAAAEGLAISPRGSGSSLGLGAPPRRLDIVLDCGRLDRIIDHSAADMVASAGAGISLDALAGCLAVHGQRLPLDPPGGGSRTLGGVLATAAAGPLRFRYGSPRDLVLGVRFVQADGTVTWGGSRVVKSVSGYDVPRLLVGSLGTLGVITEATVRLHPVPPAAASWLLGMASFPAAAGVLADLMHSSLEPDRVAVVNEGTLRALGLGAGRVGVAVSIGSVAEAVASQGEALAHLGRRHGGESRPLPAAFWGRLGEAVDGPVMIRMAGEPARLLAWLEEMERSAEARGLGVSAIGEPRSGMLQACLAGATLGPSLPGLVDGLRAALAREDGTLVLERVPVALRGRCDVWGPVPGGALDVMRRLKHELDPAGILNPGRFVGGL